MLAPDSQGLPRAPGPVGAVLLALAVVFGCGDSDGDADRPATDAATAADGATSPQRDAGAEPDAASATLDAGGPAARRDAAADAAASTDAASPVSGDAGSADAAATDSGAPDAATMDSGPLDAGPPDAGPPGERDTDGDGLSDAEEGFDAGTDTDVDGTPDFEDTDADGDGILDSDEAGDADLATPAVDTDGDGTPDFRDDDSDDDGIDDAIEAGDTDPATPPVDSDGDGTPDYRDQDSDDDGLSDLDELAAGTDPVDADSDDDGANDLVETLLGTDPGDAGDNPLANGDFAFVVPYQGDPEPSCSSPTGNECDLAFVPSPQKVDAYLLADLSGSMAAELASIKSNIATVADNLSCAPVGSGQPPDCIPDLWWGVGTIGYSGAAGAPYTNVADLQPSTTPLTSFPTTEPGGCCDETLLLGTWSTVTGQGTSTSGCNPLATYAARSDCTSSPAGALGVGYPCFRPDALPVILLATDEAPTVTFACPPLATVTTAASQIGARIIGVAATSTPAVLNDLAALASGTGAVDASGTPLAVSGIDANAPSAIEDGLRSLAQGVPFDLSAEPSDDAADAVDAVAAFVDYLQTLQLGTAECSDGLTEVDSNSDSHADTYVSVLPQTPVCWRLVPKQNTTVPATDQPQLFHATVDVLGDGFTPLASRNVYFLVPPASP